MDPEDIAHRAAAALQARAAEVAATQDALDRTLAASPARPPSRRRRWLVAAGAAAAIAALVVGVIAIRAARDEPNGRIVDAPPPTDSALSIEPSTTNEPSETTVVTQPTATEPAAVDSSAIATEPPSTSTTQPAPDLPLTNGLTLSGLPAGVVVMRSLDRLQDQPRADTITDLQLADRSIVRVVLTDVEPDWPRREASVIGGRDGWTASLQPTDSCQSCYTLYGSVVSGVARRLDDDTWLLVESTPGEASLNVPDQLPVAAPDLLRVVAESATYEPAADHRVVARTAVDPASLFGPACTDATATVSGTPGAPDVVLFTCDGMLAVYDGETGERTRVISQFVAPGAPPDPTTEGSGPGYVDGIAVTPDGHTLFYSEGPEPVSGTTFELDLVDEAAAPEPRFGGWGPVVDPTGRFIALSALDMVIVQDLSDGTSRTISMEGGQVGGAPSFSPDGTTLAVEMFGGTVALIDVASTSVRLIASDDPQTLYGQPHLTETGLQVLATCCTGGSADPVSMLNLDTDGVVVGASSEFEPAPFEYVYGADGQALILRGTSLEFGGQVIATGVLEAAIVPSP